MKGTSKKFMFKILNRNDLAPKGYTVIYAGRPSALGNPFPMREEKDRDAVCDKYAAWLRIEVKKQGPLRSAMIDLYRRNKAGENIALRCFCAPRRCHCDEIVKYLSELK